MPEKPLSTPSVNGVRWFSPLKIVLACAVIFLVWLAVYFPDYARLNSLRQANKKLKEDIAGLEKEVNQLKDKMARVGSDPLIYEKVAREELGAVKEDEIVVDIEE